MSGRTGTCKMNGLYSASYLSPLGEITLASDGFVLTGLWFNGQKYFGSTLAANCARKDLPVFEETRRWLDVYFSGKEPDFCPPIGLSGSPFRMAVFKALRAVPYGGTTTYGKIAAELEKERGKGKVSARAVGAAVGRNPISVIVPCHRVLGAGGKLTGYAGGTEKKSYLLKLEGAAFLQEK